MRRGRDPCAEPRRGGEGKGEAPGVMSFHKGNAFLTNVTADNLRTPWKTWYLEVQDAFASQIVDDLTHAKYFDTKNMVIVSLHLTVSMSVSTPSGYTTIGVKLPEDLRVRSGTTFRNQCVIEKMTNTVERKFCSGALVVDGASQGGTDGTTYLYLDRLFIENLGQFIGGQQYVVRGQLVFEPS